MHCTCSHALVRKGFPAIVALTMAATGCDAGFRHIDLSLADAPLAVTEAQIDPFLPPGDDSWNGPEAHAGASRSVRNTLPWYPRERGRVLLPEPVLPTTLRYAQGYVLAAGREVVYVVDSRRLEIVARLCIAELRCGDGDDSDFLAHLWDPYTGPFHLRTAVWTDEAGERHAIAIFGDAVDTAFSNDYHFKLFQLDRLPEDGSTVDADHILTVPKTNRTPWFENWWLDGPQLLLHKRRLGPGGREEHILELHRLQVSGAGLSSARDWQRYFRESTTETDRTATDVVEGARLAHLRFRGDTIAFVEATGQRLVALDAADGAERWRRPGVPAGGMLDPETILAGDEELFAYWGDTAGSPERFAAYRFADGEAQRTCAPDDALAAAIQYPHWAAISRDGAWFIGMTAGRLERIHVPDCELASFAADTLGDVAIVPWAPGETIEPQRTAVAANVSLFGLTYDQDPAATGKTTWIALWPHDADVPVTAVGPVSTATEDGPPASQDRHFIVAGHDLVLVSGENQAELFFYGDDVTPTISAPFLDTEGRIVFTTEDAGGPLWGLLVVRTGPDGSEVVFQQNPLSPGMWAIATDDLVAGDHRLRAVAIDLAGNWALSPTVRLRIRE